MPRCERPEMFVGGTCTHIFEFPFYCDEGFDSITVTYAQQDGAEVVKDVDPESIIDDGCSRYVECTLTPEETSLFSDTLLDCLAQVRASKNGVVLFSKLFRVDVRRTIGDGR